MKASRFTDARNAFICEQGADRRPVAKTCRKAGISEATTFKWRRKCDGLLPDETRRLRPLEDANATQNTFVVGLSLNKAVELDQEVLH